MSPRSPSSHPAGPTRFRTILLFTTALGLTAAGTIGPLSGRAPDGVMFRGGPEHTGVYPNARPLSSYGGMLWRVQTDGPVRSTPAIGQGMVFVGSGDFHLYALDERSGRVLWRYRADAGVTGSPALSEGVVYVTDQASTVHAVDVETGELVWRVPTGPDRPLPWGHESGDVWASSPTLVDDVLYVGSGDGHLYALDRATGQTRWRFATEGRVRSTPAVAEGRVYVGSGDGRVYALDASSGDLLWRADTEGVSLFSGDFGFDRRTVQSSPAVADGRVFVGARDGFLYALDAASGRRLWRVDHQVSWVNGSPAVARGLVVVGSSDGRFVHAVDAVTGEERWRVGTHDIVWGSPAMRPGPLHGRRRSDPGRRAGDGGGPVGGAPPFARPWLGRTGRRRRLCRGRRWRRLRLERRRRPTARAGRLLGQHACPSILDAARRGGPLAGAPGL